MGFGQDVSNMLTGWFKGELNKISKLDKSDQVYHFSYDNSLGSSNKGATTYDFNTNKVMVNFGTGANSELIAHEFTHAYQFEKGEVSFARGNTTGAALFDINDEVDAYNIQLQDHDPFTFNQAPKYTEASVRALQVTDSNGNTVSPYKNLPSGSINLHSKEGKNLVRQTIEAGKNGTLYRKYILDGKKTTLKV